MRDALQPRWTESSPRLRTWWGKWSRWWTWFGCGWGRKTDQSKSERTSVSHVSKKGKQHDNTKVGQSSAECNLREALDSLQDDIELSPLAGTNGNTSGLNEKNWQRVESIESFCFALYIQCLLSVKFPPCAFNRKMFREKYCKCLTVRPKKQMLTKRAHHHLDKDTTKSRRTRFTALQHSALICIYYNSHTGCRSRYVSCSSLLGLSPSMALIYTGSAW